MTITPTSRFRGLPRVYPLGVQMERVQAFISKEDFNTLFRDGLWLRGGQDRIIATFLQGFAKLLREEGITEPDLDNTIKVLRLLNNVKLTYDGEPTNN